jgi:hypothetical protein
MGALTLGEREDEAPHIVGKGAWPRRRLPAGGDVAFADVGIGIGIVLGKAHATRHVKNVMKPGVAIAGCFKFGEVVSDQRLRVEHALADERPSAGGGDRFCHRL